MTEWFVTGIQEQYTTLRDQLLGSAAEQTREARQYHVEQLRASVTEAQSIYKKLRDTRQHHQQHQHQWIVGNQLVDKANITVVEGTGIATSCPYAKLTIADAQGNSKTLRTQTLQKTTSPCWASDDASACTFRVETLHGTEAVLEVYDSGIFVDSLIGGTWIAVSSLIFHPLTPSHF